MLKDIFSLLFDKIVVSAAKNNRRCEWIHFPQRKLLGVVAIKTKRLLDACLGCLQNLQLVT